MKTDITTKTPTEAATDAMRDALAALKKPSRLLIAERELTAGRNARSHLAAEHQLKVTENYLAASAGRGSPALAAAVRDGEEALRQCDQTIAAKRAALAAERQAFAPTFAAAIAEPSRDIAVEISEHLAEVAKLLDALREAGRFAERNGIDAPAKLQGLHWASSYLVDLRRVLGIK